MSHGAGSRLTVMLLPPSLQVAEMATQFFITNDRPNVAGLVLAGSADFKTELSQSDMFDPRLQAVVLGVVDVSYGEQQTAAHWLMLQG
jgi:peptide subunit release factor 1 (eRF1)